MTDFALFSTLIDCIRQGGSPVLCTIVDSAGSAPRGAGARMALLPDGTWLGTVGGGAVEHQVTLDAQALWRDGAGPLRKHYDLSHAAAELGMVCGGKIDVEFEVRR